MNKLFLVNGPNLNLLGDREKNIYGSITLAEIVDRLKQKLKNKMELVPFQSNCEGEVIDFIQSIRLVKNQTSGIIINAASLTHTSIGIRDALSLIDLPFVEVHLSNVYAREKFRAQSYLSDKAVGLIVGLGPLGYELAAEYFLKNSS